MATSVDEAIHHLSATSDPASDEEVGEFERVPVTISEEPIADEEELIGGSYIA